MKSIFITLIIWINIWTLMSSQNIKFCDFESGKALSQVSVYDSSYHLLGVSGQNGLLIYNPESHFPLYVKHPEYQNMIITKRVLSSIDTTIYLSSKEISLEEVVVSASRIDQNIRDIAQPIKSINSDKISIINQQTSADLLQSTGMVLVQKSQQGGGSPIIRGFETNKVLIVVDGVRMNNAIYRGGHLQNVITLDQNNLDKLEILFGPASVTYGSDALGGVMHFITKNPEYSEDQKLLNRMKIFTRYSTANNEVSGHIDYSITKGRWGSYFSFTISQFGDLRQGGVRRRGFGSWGKRFWYVERFNGIDSIMQNPKPNLQLGSAYMQWDIIEKLQYKTKTGILHEINFQWSQSNNIPRYDRLVLERNGLPRFAEWYYGPQKRQMVAYTIKNNVSLKFSDFYQFIFAYQKIQESRYDRSYKSDWLNRRKEDLNIFSINTDFQKKISRVQFNYGVDSWVNFVESKANKLHIVQLNQEALDTRYPRGGSNMKSLAFYFSGVIRLNSRVIFNSGIRIGYVGLFANFRDSMFFKFPEQEVTQHHFVKSGSMGFMYRWKNSNRVYLSASTGFRAPNIDDLGKIFESQPGSIILPNPNLKAESTFNLDLGFDIRLMDKLSLLTGVYHCWYRDAITVQSYKYLGQDSIVYDGVLSRVSAAQNTRKAFIYGVYHSLKYKITKHLVLEHHINYTFGRIHTDTTLYPLDHIPPVFGMLNIEYKTKKYFTIFSIRYNGVKRSKDYNLYGEDNALYSLDPINGSMPAWYTINFNQGIRIGKKLEIQMGVENILDRNYRIYASNISAPGINGVIRLQYQI